WPSLNSAEQATPPASSKAASVSARSRGVMTWCMAAMTCRMAPGSAQTLDIRCHRIDLCVGQAGRDAAHDLVRVAGSGTRLVGTQLGGDIGRVLALDRR